MELYYGAERSRDPHGNKTNIEGFVARLELLQYDAGAALHTGLIRKELQTNGEPIGAYDCMIAGQARSRGLILVTRNFSEFERVRGLRVERWG